MQFRLIKDINLHRLLLQHRLQLWQGHHDLANETRHQSSKLAQDHQRHQHLQRQQPTDAKLFDYQIQWWSTLRKEDLHRDHRQHQDWPFR